MSRFGTPFGEFNLPWLEWELMQLYSPRIIVIGQGEGGAMLLEQNGQSIHFPAIKTRPVVSTIGAGDALFASFLNFYVKGFPAQEALKRAMVFASWKIGTRGAAQGFLNAREFEQVYSQVEGTAK